MERGWKRNSEERSVELSCVWCCTKSCLRVGGGGDGAVVLIEC